MSKSNQPMRERGYAYAVRIAPHQSDGRAIERLRIMRAWMSGYRAGRVASKRKARP